LSYLVDFSYLTFFSVLKVKMVKGAIAKWGYGRGPHLP